MQDYFVYVPEENPNRKINKKQIIKWFVIIFVIVLSLSAFIFSILFFPKENNQFHSSGNNFGNISCGGYTVGVDNFVYFSNANDNYGIWRYNTETGEYSKLSSEQSWCINYYDGWLYYSNFDDGYSIHKLKTDGSEDVKLNNTKSLYLNICNGYIYYADSSRGGYIFKMDINGKNIEQLNKNKSVYLCLYDDWIYFSNSSDNSYIYKIKTDGTGETLLCKQDAKYLNIHNNKLYFTSYEDTTKFLYNIYCVGLNGTGLKKICDEYCKNIIVYGDYIYYIIADNERIGRCKIDGSSPEIIFNLDNGLIEIKYISVSNDKIFYCAGNDDDVNYSYIIELDGTNNRLAK